MSKPHPQAKKPEEDKVKLTYGSDRLKKDGRFLCSVRFINDLPEIPCDPKMLLAPYNPQELAAFSLTALEKETNQDVLFQQDAGIPITPLDIERYTIPAAGAPALHPKDAALLQDATIDGLRAKPRGDAAEASWLLRTKYITNELVEPGKKRPGSQSQSQSQAAVEEPFPELTKEAQIAAIEKTFSEATAVPVHPRKPDLQPVEILPILPDEIMDEWACVLAAFDGNPTEDVARLATLSEPEKHVAIQSAQLKSFAKRKADGSADRFVAFMLPINPNTSTVEVDNDAVVLPAADLQGDYEWIREYNSVVRYDEKGETFLFRMAGDHVAYHDLNTKVSLRKRKRQTDTSEDAFLQPDKFVLRLPGEAGDDVEMVAKEDEEEAVVANASEGQEVGARDTAAIMQDVFGSSDDDDA